MDECAHSIITPLIDLLKSLQATDSLMFNQAIISEQFRTEVFYFLGLLARNGI